MKPISEKTYHTLFDIGIIIKGVIALGEIVAGFAFAFFSYDTLYKVLFSIFGGELTESPRDLIWTYIVNSMHGFSSTPQAVWAFIFLSHGVVKLFFIAALLRDKLWAYPASAIIFALFIVYQLYQLTFTPSFILWAITILDAIVIALILHEYRYKKSHALPL